MVCPRCGSNNVTINMVSESRTKNRGCFSWFLWIFLAIITCGLILIIPLLTNTKTKYREYPKALCLNCGKHWRV